MLANMLRGGLLALGLSLMLSGFALADELTPEKRKDVARYLELSGNKAMAQQMLQQYVKQSMGLVKKLRPDIPAASLPAVERELSQFLAEKFSGPGGLFEQLVPLYAKHFSHDEIRQLLAFHESPTGRKAVAVLPQVVKEGSDAAQRMGISLIPEINRRVSEALQRDAQRREAESAAPRQPVQQL